MGEVIEIPYKPREVFLPYHQTDKRFCITVAHRRAGKTVARINKLLRQAVECQKPNPRFGYLAPYYIQAKDIAWNYLKEFSAPLQALGLKVNESELSIVLPHNNATIRLYGAENAERLRGVYFDGLVVDEGQGINKSVLTSVIMPALADREGWLDVSGTPRGWFNLLGELLKMAQESDEWFYQILKASQTGLIPAAELKRQRSLMPEDEYNQEFECDFDAAVKGAYYASLIRDAEADGRISGVPYDPSCSVITAWDLGYGDSTSIWFAQIVGKEPRIIDFYEASGVSIEHYIKVIRERPYNYEMHYLPHDAAAGSLRTGQSLSQQLKTMGVNNEVLLRADIESGISLVRQLIPQCWFDKSKCAEGINALRHYQSKWDEKRGVYQPRPLHDWSSHASDAFRYLAHAIDKKKNKNGIEDNAESVGPVLSWAAY